MRSYPPEAPVAKLDSLNQQVRSCRLCRLCRLRVNGVPGEGDAAAEVMFIGEAPGFHEDREGRPFVGPAGQFLDELLGLAGLDRKAVYITNVVKCRPPQNRDPLPDEQAACGPYLARQIAAIDPLLIVTLGRYSMYHFFPDDKISAVHGQAREVDGRVVMMMLHPSYGLRSPEGRESLKTDFRKLPAVLTEARAARTRRAAPEPPVPIDVDALVAAHLRTRPDSAAARRPGPTRARGARGRLCLPRRRRARTQARPGRPQGRAPGRGGAYAHPTGGRTRGRTGNAGPGSGSRSASALAAPGDAARR